MKCNKCNGTGKSKYGYGQPCTHCDGKGIVKPLTNEEWFCQLPTYKKAIIMANCYNAFNLDEYACNKHVVIEEWLQEEHKE